MPIITNEMLAQQLRAFMKQQEATQVVLGNMANDLAGVVHLLGREKVDAAVAELAELGLRRQIRDLLGAGKIAPSMRVGGSSTFLGCPVHDDGNDGAAVCVRFSAMDTEDQQAVAGAAPGDVVTMPSGGRLKINEIYDPSNGAAVITT